MRGILADGPQGASAGWQAGRRAALYFWPAIRSEEPGRRTGTAFRLEEQLPEATPSAQGSPVCSQGRQCPYPPCGTCRTTDRGAREGDAGADCHAGFQGTRSAMRHVDQCFRLARSENPTPTGTRACTCSQQIMRWKPRLNQRLLSTQIVGKNQNVTSTSCLFLKMQVDTLLCGSSLQRLGDAE